jgi:cytochrome c oxidase subunit 4
MTTATAHASAGHDSGHEHVHSIWSYVWVFIALLLLLAAAVGVAFVPTENYTLRFALTAAAYTIAVVKAVLIILWFMHVKESSRLTWLFAGAAFLWLAIMILGTLNDYSSRGMIRQPFQKAPAVNASFPNGNVP